ncbi:hypothetical protein ACH5RR_013378 [Cinchona calisaya]|uniref:Uncharacterized protein n=1 Tax=Cinchona calisaya TaxID=153742 RepID=A0ABD2ZZW3_9GENT
MLFKSFFQKSPLISILFKAVAFSTSQTNLPNWVSHNKLFQRHPRLHFLENHCQSLHQLKQILSYVFVSGLHRNPFVTSRVLYICLFALGGNKKTNSRIGIRIFDRIPKPNLFSWNTIIRFFASSDDCENAALVAFLYYMKMLSVGIFPDKYTFPFVLQVCRSVSDLGLVKQVHSHVFKLGFDEDLFVGNSVLNACLVCGNLCYAREVFDEMAERDVVSWTTLISGLVALGYCGEAVNVFNEMTKNGWTLPNAATIACVLSACGDLLDTTKCLHALLEKAGWIELDVSIRNSLIDAYAKCGSLDNATEVFNDVDDLQKDLYTWTAIISGLAMNGEGRYAYEYFARMELESGISPDAITFVAILSACVHSGLVEEGLCIFESMRTKYGIKPDLKHYGCVIDLLGRCGMLDRAYHVLDTMPVKPNLAILGSLLNACRLHNNMELGEEVSRKIELLQGSSGGTPVLLSNMYANVNRWDEVINVRKEMRAEIQEKPPGRSWIQIKDAVHEFVVGDKSHPQAKELCTVLEGLEGLTKMLTF